VSFTHILTVTVALILDLLGVNREDIADDFHASEAYGMSPAGQMFHAGRSDWIDMNEWCSAPRELILFTLKYMDAKYGGIHPYLTSIGFGAALQHKLVDVLSGRESDRTLRWLVSKL
jgi:hypothetical protein